VASQESAMADSASPLLSAGKVTKLVGQSLAQSCSWALPWAGSRCYLWA
jgi:hypothetical protein